MNRLKNRGNLLRSLIIALLVFGASAVVAQPISFDFLRSGISTPDRSSEPKPPDAEFSFARLAYGQTLGNFSDRIPWTTDWPEAETHFLEGLTRLSLVETSDLGRTVRLTDPALFDFPWLYAVDVGKWSLSNEEAGLLREYLLRGGFLMVDDFHGSYEWQVFYSHLRKAFPDRPVAEIPDDDPLMSIMYELDKSIQIPGIRALNSGQTWEQDGYTPFWRGIYDDEGRLMVAINFNMDLGDAWEHADDPGYPEPMTSLAYRFAVNYVIYAMSH